MAATWLATDSGRRGGFLAGRFVAALFFLLHAARCRGERLRALQRDT